MVARILVEKDIEAGRRLLEELDRQRVDITAAAWFFVADAERWRLLLASPIVDEKGPLAAYEVIQNTLTRMPETARPTFTDISAVSPSDRRVRAMAVAVKTGPGIHDVRFSRTVVGDMYVEDALVYRSN